ncbi:hypothetical protein GA0115261_102691, partial [Streptomyces sp. OspMP-M43]
MGGTGRGPAVTGRKRYPERVATGGARD